MRVQRSCAFFLLTIVLTTLTACVEDEEDTDPTQTTVVSPEWGNLPGWESDRHSEAWPALLQNCKVMPKKDPVWQPICDIAKLLPAPDDQTAREFFEKYFEPQQLFSSDGSADGL